MIPLFAMHMANELLSVPVAAVTIAIAAAVVVLASRRAGRNININDNNLPLMGVMGAFVFAAQMINFTLPGMPGTSGHLGGGVLLAILLGPAAGIVTMTAILIVQCLVFQDGGLLALGCNIINLGVVPCLLGGWVYQALLGPIDKAAAWRQYWAAWMACVVGVTAGAAMVPIEAGFSGVLRIPTNQFLGVMVGVHLIIALCEGAVTFAVIAYLRHVKPELLGMETTDLPVAPYQLGYGAVGASLLITALLLAGVVSWFASTLPDGLEWSYAEHRYGTVESNVINDSPVIGAVDQWQSKWSLMTDYGKRDTPLGVETTTGAIATASDGNVSAGSAWPNMDGWRSLAGVLGTIITLCILFGVSKLIKKTVNG